jgi:hypothetical protein
MPSKAEIRDALVWGRWQAHALVYSHMLIGWCIAMYVHPSGVSALAGLAVGGAVGCIVLWQLTEWES